MRLLASPGPSRARTLTITGGLVVVGLLLSGVLREPVAGDRHREAV